MNEIFKNFKSSSPREKLGIVADLFGIAGISLAAIVGGLLSIKRTVNMQSLIFAIAYSLICLGGVIIALVIFIIVTGFIKERFPSKPHIRLALIISIWLFLIAAFLIASVFYLDIVSSFRVFKNNA